MSHPGDSNPERGKVKEVKVVTLADVELNSGRRVRFTSGYTIGKYYVLRVIPNLITRTVEMFGKERQEFYFVGIIEEFDSIKEATEAFRHDINIDDIVENGMAIAVPKSLLRQIIKKIKEMDPDVLHGKGIIIAIIHIGDSGRTVKRGGKEYPVRQYTLLDLNIVVPEEIQTTEGETTSVMALLPVQELIQELKNLLGVGGDENEAQE